MKKFDDDKLFTAGGYYDIDYIMSCDYTFTVIMGARGTGKTYVVNRYILDNNFDKNLEEDVIKMLEGMK